MKNRSSGGTALLSYKSLINLLKYNLDWINTKVCIYKKIQADKTITTPNLCFTASPVFVPHSLPDPWLAHLTPWLTHWPAIMMPWFAHQIQIVCCKAWRSDKEIEVRKMITTLNTYRSFAIWRGYLRPRKKTHQLLEVISRPNRNQFPNNIKV